MAYEQRDCAGSLFRNDKKEADTHADYRGSAKIGGVEYFLDAWINTSNSGVKYMALKFKPKEAKGGYSGSYNGDPRTNSSGGAAQRTPIVPLDDDIPW